MRTTVFGTLLLSSEPREVDGTCQIVVIGRGLFDRREPAVSHGVSTARGSNRSTTCGFLHGF